MCTDGKKSPTENNDCVLYLKILRLYGVQILGRYIHKKTVFMYISYFSHYTYLYVCISQ